MSRVEELNWDRESLKEKNGFPLCVSIILTLLELFMNLHIINECLNDWIR